MDPAFDDSPLDAKPSLLQPPLGLLVIFGLDCSEDGAVLFIQLAFIGAILSFRPALKTVVLSSSSWFFHTGGLLTLLPYCDEDGGDLFLALVPFKRSSLCTSS
ncbi:hypothetical protein TNCT_419601 [Trichonephila clavata]|uniref:Uncharacterized protein n=1 Tax=Trichonephila clavata TaxID=2740835 RepID=A0A8X6J5Y8_TRICU|nr:hypothetical protein TNCT_419601 [Trichonephila clavata]